MTGHDDVPSPTVIGNGDFGGICNRAEFIAVSFWVSGQAIQGFAGQDIEKAVFYPDDDRFLVERDLTVRHYQVAGGRGNGMKWGPGSGCGMVPLTLE